ncbi:MAG: TauD/TfdA family dioxygenase [Gammaproteobacteria bacterium]
MNAGISDRVQTPVSSTSDGVTPFALDNDASYRGWRQAKLAHYPSCIDDLVVEVGDINHLTDGEYQALLALCKKTNMAIYKSRQPLASKNGLGEVCAKFELHRLDKNLYADDDGISALQVSEQKRQFEYIPYSDKGIRWHTDGYYNHPDRKIRAMVLHCERPANAGGANMLLDYEMVYIMMRDENPEFIEALMQPDAMTIPANVEQGMEIRPAQTGPVFSVDSESGDLHMRYTARTKSIAWKDEPTVKRAVAWLEALLATELPYIFEYRLQAGEGILSNNVLHGRTTFQDGDEAQNQRLMYRARYYDRIAGTSVNDY